MDINNSFDHLAFNNLLECNVDSISSHLKVETILIDHMFVSKLVIEKLCSLPSTKARLFILLNRLLSMSFRSTHFDIRCLEI